MKQTSYCHMLKCAFADSLLGRPKMWWYFSYICERHQFDEMLFTWNFQHFILAQINKIHRKRRLALVPFLCFFSIKYRHRRTSCVAHKILPCFKSNNNCMHHCFRNVCVFFFLSWETSQASCIVSKWMCFFSLWNEQKRQRIVYVTVYGMFWCVRYAVFINLCCASSLFRENAHRETEFASQPPPPQINRHRKYLDRMK